MTELHVFMELMKNAFLSDILSKQKKSKFSFSVINKCFIPVQPNIEKNALFLFWKLWNKRLWNVSIYYGLNLFWRTIYLVQPSKACSCSPRGFIDEMIDSGGVHNMLHGDISCASPIGSLKRDNKSRSTPLLLAIKKADCILEIVCSQTQTKIIYSLIA